MGVELVVDQYDHAGSAGEVSEAAGALIRENVRTLDAER